MYWIDPLRDSRWGSFVVRHPQGSIFHTPSWLEALRRTYGYRPVALTNCPPGVELVDGIPFCEVKSWINGSRLVSLPFSDHCQPLLKRSSDLPDFISCLRDQCGRSSWGYIEIRPVEVASALTETEPLSTNQSQRVNGCAFSLATYQEYYLHKIDLRADVDSLFDNFHKGCIQRKIRRADRERLEYHAGRSESTLEKFYGLQLLTRRRHRLPPQPIAWFRNLRECFGENLTIRVASKDGQPVASILTLLHKKTLVYKYGCSDAALHKLGAMPMLFWKAIQEEKQRATEEFDLGRSTMNNPGLSAFKQHLGAACSKLSYYRLGDREVSITDSSMRIVRAVFARMPGPLAQVAGNLLYRHMG